MTPVSRRSTRDKIRWQADKMCECLERFQGHCEKMTLLGAMHSVVVEDRIPLMMAASQELWKAVQKFRMEL